MSNNDISDEKNYNMKETQVTDKNYGIGIRHLQVACICLVTLSLFIIRSMMGVAILAMTDQSRADGPDVFAWDKKIQGYILSSFFCGYAVMQLPGGLLAKRFGGKITIMVALLANGIICFVLPTLAKVGGWKLVCVCRIVMGLTQSSLVPSIHTLLGRWLPPREITSLSGLIGASTCIGVIISMPISGFLAETVLGWKLIFYFSGSLLMIVAVIWWTFSASTPKEHRMINAEERNYIEKGRSSNGTENSMNVPWKAIFTSKGAWAICVSHTIFTIGYIFFFVDLPTYLEKGLSLSLRNSATLSALPYVGMLLGTLISTSLFDKLVNSGFISLEKSRKVFNSIGMFGFAISILSLTFVDSESNILAVGIIVIALFLQSAASAGYMVNNMDLSPNWSGVLMGLTNTSANIGSIITPLMTSWILRNDPTDMSRWRVAFTTVSGLVVLAGVSYLVFGTADRQPWDDPSYMDRTKDQKAILKSVKYCKVGATDNNTSCTISDKHVHTIENENKD